MADTSQPTVFDYATGTQFRVAFNRIPKVNWFCTGATLPGISIGEASYPTPMTDVGITGDKITFENLTITFLVDEELQNYREIWNWIIGIGAPVTHQQWATALTTGDSDSITKFQAVGSEDNIDPRQKPATSEANLYSDATLIVYNSKNKAVVEVKFKDMFPLSISSLEYSQALTDVEYFTATATFKYLYYEFATVT